MTIQEKAERILKGIKKEKGNNPIQIFKILRRMITLICMDQNIIF